MNNIISVSDAFKSGCKDPERLFEHAVGIKNVTKDIDITNYVDLQNIKNTAEKTGRFGLVSSNTINFTVELPTDGDVTSVITEGDTIQLTDTFNGEEIVTTTGTVQKIPTQYKNLEHTYKVTVYDRVKDGLKAKFERNEVKLGWYACNNNYPEQSLAHYLAYKAGVRSENKTGVMFYGKGRVEIPNSSLINTSEVHEMTIEVEFATGGDIDSRQTIYEEGGASNGAGIYILDGKVYAGIWSEYQGWYGDWLNKQIERNKGYHVALTFVYPGYITLYVNGVEIDSIASPTFLDTHTGDIALGAFYDGTKFADGDVSGEGAHFNGLIKRFRRWSTERSQTEIQNNIDVDLVGDETGLIVGYQFHNESDGYIAHDISSNNLNGTMVDVGWAYDGIRFEDVTDSAGAHLVVPYAHFEKGRKVMEEFSELVASVRGALFADHDNQLVLTTPFNESDYDDIGFTFNTNIINEIEVGSEEAEHDQVKVTYDSFDVLERQLCWMYYKKDNYDAANDKAHMRIPAGETSSWIRVNWITPIAVQLEADVPEIEIDDDAGTDMSAYFQYDLDVDFTGGKVRFHNLSDTQDIYIQKFKIFGKPLRKLEGNETTYAEVSTIENPFEISNKFIQSEAHAEMIAKYTHHIECKDRKTYGLTAYYLPFLAIGNKVGVNKRDINVQATTDKRVHSANGNRMQTRVELKEFLPYPTLFSGTLETVEASYDLQSDISDFEDEKITGGEGLPVPVPTNVTGMGSFKHVWIEWDSSTRGDLLGYNVYITHDTVLKKYFVKSNAFMFDAGLSETYDIQVSQVTKSGESNKSGSISVTTEGGVDWTEVENAAVGTNDLVNAAITAVKVATDAIDETKIADGAVGTGQLANDSIDGNKIKNSIIDTAHLIDRAVNATKIALLAVGTGHIENAAITNAKIANLAVDNAKIDNLAVDTGKIADAAINNAKIANLAVSTAKLADAAISTAKIEDAAIIEAKIGNLAVNTAKIATAAITEAKIADLQVSTAKLKDAAITNAKIKNLAVDTGKLADASITTAKIENLAVTDAKIGSVEADKISTNRAKIQSAQIESVQAEQLMVGDFPANLVKPKPVNAQLWHFDRSFISTDGLNYTEGIPLLRPQIGIGFNGAMEVLDDIMYEVQDSGLFTISTVRSPVVHQIDNAETGMSDGLNNLVETTEGIHLPFPLEDGLVAYWGCEESGGDWLESYQPLSDGDSRMDNYRAELIQNPSCLYFDGTAYGEIALTPAEEDTLGTDREGLLSMWIKCPDMTPKQMLFDTALDRDREMFIENGTLYIAQYNGVLGDEITASYDISAWENTWFNIGFNWQQSGAEIRIYLNGNQVTSAGGDPDTEVSNGDKYVIGAGVAGDNKYSGYIDNVIFFKDNNTYAYNWFKPRYDSGDDNIALFYDCNEGSGTTAIDAVGNYDMVLTNVTYETNDVPLKPPQRVAGKYGSGLLFTKSDLSQLPIEGLNYSGQEQITELTLMAWIKTSDTVTEQCIISFDRSKYFRFAIGGEENYMEETPTVTGEAGKLLFCTSTPTDGTVDSVGTITVADGQWHHVAVTFNSSTGEKKFYVDGQLDTTATLTTPEALGETDASENPRYGFIGNGTEAENFDGACSPEMTFNGYLDEIGYYHKELSQTEIQSAMNRRIADLEGTREFSNDLSVLETAHKGFIKWSSLNTTFNGFNSIYLGDIHSPSSLGYVVSIKAKVTFNDLSGHRAIFADGGGTNGIEFGLYNGNLRLGIQSGDTDIYVDYPVENLETGVEYELEGIADGPNGNAYVKVNGTVVAQDESFAAFETFDGSNGTTIGSYWDQSPSADLNEDNEGGFFKGIIKEVQVWGSYNLTGGMSEVDGTESDLHFVWWGEGKVEVSYDNTNWYQCANGEELPNLPTDLSGTTIYIKQRIMSYNRLYYTTINGIDVVVIGDSKTYVLRSDGVKYVDGLRNDAADTSFISYNNGELSLLAGNAFDELLYSPDIETEALIKNWFNSDTPFYDPESVVAGKNVQIGPEGFKAFDSEGTKTVDIGSETGDAFFRGQVLGAVYNE